MTIYQYIASVNPNDCMLVCNKYGYAIPQNVVTADDLGDFMENVVVNDVGKPAFIDFLNLHPDKEVIVEAYGTSASGATGNEPASGATQKKCGCGGGCGGGKKCGGGSSAMDAYLHTSQSNNTSNMMQQGHILLMATALILAVAIIVSK